MKVNAQGATHNNPGIPQEALGRAQCSFISEGESTIVFRRRFEKDVCIGGNKVEKNRKLHFLKVSLHLCNTFLDDFSLTLHIHLKFVSGPGPHLPFGLSISLQNSHAFLTIFISLKPKITKYQ